MKKRIRYFMIFCIGLVIEIYIGLYIKDTWIRPYVGDILIVPVVYWFLRVIFPEKPRRLDVGVILMAILVEFSQAIHLDRLLKIQGTVLGIIVGSTFDWKDIFCYGLGGLLVFVVEKSLNVQKEQL